MKYAVAASITLLLVLTLSCGADNSDTEPESVTEVQSQSEIFLSENWFESVNEANKRGDLPLQLAVLNNDIQMVGLLIADGADIDARGQYGATPLSCASISGYYDIAELLVEEGADVNFRVENEHYSETPLHQAAGKGYTEIVEILLNAGADLEAEGIGGMTPLHMASGEGHLEVVELLIANGAEVDAVSVEPQLTPLQIALNTEDYTVAALLTKSGANDEELYVLDTDRAGLFKIGINDYEIQEIAVVYGDVILEEVDLMLEGMSAPAMEMTLAGDSLPGLILEIDPNDCGCVYRIIVYSDRFRTSDGIGVSSTVANILEYYDFGDVYWSERGDPFIFIEELDASIILNPGDWWVMGEVQGELPPETEVKAILIL